MKCIAFAVAAVVAAWVFVGIVGVMSGSRDVVTTSFMDAVEGFVPHRMINGHECVYVHGEWLVVVKE